MLLRPIISILSSPYYILIQSAVHYLPFFTSLFSHGQWFIALYLPDTNQVFICRYWALRTGILKANGRIISFISLQITHPAGCFVQFIRYFGEKIFILWKLILLQQRILFFSPPPAGISSYRGTLFHNFNISFKYQIALLNRCHSGRCFSYNMIGESDF